MDSLLVLDAQVEDIVNFNQSLLDVRLLISGVARADYLALTTQNSFW